MILLFFSWIFLLIALGLLLGAYTSGDLAKLAGQIKWLWKVKKQRIRIWFKFHSEIIFKRKIYRHLWHLIIRKCPMCLQRGKMSLIHQNCAYVDEMSNYYWLCEDCQQEVHDHYQELWDEYNSGRL